MRIPHNTLWILSIKNLLQHMEEMAWSPGKKYKSTLLVYPSTDIPNYMSKGEKSKFSDLKGMDLRGHYSLRKVTILSKVYRWSSACRRGAFVKWHVSLCIFKETVELLIKCRRKKSLGLYVKIDFSAEAKQYFDLIFILFVFCSSVWYFQTC